MGFEFGKRSMKQIATMHPDLQMIYKESIKRSKIDFGISEGHRSLERQYKLFLEGKSKIDGKTKKGKHNYVPSLAGDHYIYHPDVNMRRKMAYDRVHMAYVAGIMDSVSEELFAAGKITHKLRWGANWDNDGIIDFDQSFDDYPHHELIKP